VLLLEALSVLALSQSKEVSVLNILPVSALNDLKTVAFSSDEEAGVVNRFESHPSIFLTLDERGIALVE